MILPNKPGVELLSIRTLGGLAIWLDAPEVDAPGTWAVPRVRSQTIALETRTVEALLVYLACLGRPVARDILAELLWPERTQAQSRANLSLALHRLRRQLAPYLLVSRQSIALNPNARIELDVAQFEAYLAAGQLAAATALYAGDFLDGFSLRDSPAFEQWALLERERLRTLAIAAYQQLSLQRAAVGEATPPSPAPNGCSNSILFTSLPTANSCGCWRKAANAAPPSPNTKAAANCSRPNWR